MSTISDPTKFRNNIRVRLNKIIRKKKIAENLEKGIYNYAIKVAKEKKVVRKWENKYFTMLYIDKFKSIYNNLNKRGTVGNTTLLKRLKKLEFQRCGSR